MWRQKRELQRGGTGRRMEEPPRSVPVGLNHKDGGDGKDGRERQERSVQVLMMLKVLEPMEGDGEGEDQESVHHGA